MNLKLVKGFFIVLGGLFVFITLFSLLIPSRVRITRAVVIQSTASKVYPELADLARWKNWQPVFKADSTAITLTAGASGLADAAAWESAGKKNLLTITSRNGHAVSATLQRKGESTTEYNISVLPLADSGQVQVEWNVLVKLKWYPWEKFSGIFIEKMTGDGYEAALNSLKQYVENN